MVTPCKLITNLLSDESLSLTIKRSLAPLPFIATAELDITGENRVEVSSSSYWGLTRFKPTLYSVSVPLARNGLPIRSLNTPTPDGP